MSKTVYPNPFISQRADPHIWRHSDGHYYFIASVPEFDRLEIRRAATLEGLAEVRPRVVWRKHSGGPMSALIWAPELHYINGNWYIYFAAAPSDKIIKGLFQHRMFVLECSDADPLSGKWQEKGRIATPLDSFSLDGTHFAHNGKNYYLWAQKDPAIEGNSNLYLAEMSNPWTLKSAPVMISKPEFAWEKVGFAVNEGPAVINGYDKIFVTYSASATDENYCMGMLWADIEGDITDPAQWQKSPTPVFKTQADNRQFGPGHNSFTQNEKGEDVLVYHARNYTEIQGDPLYDPNRHTRLKVIDWDDDGVPVFGEPPADNH